jgi:hypothetical protein
MQDFVDMAEAHAWTLQRLREMGGRLTEQAYQRACAAAANRLDDEAHARWMLVFDRMARGLRLSIALEAKLARERRRDAAEIGEELVRAATQQHHAPRWRAPAARSRDIEPRECDREADDDGLPADATLSQRLDRLRTILEAPPEETQPKVRFRWDADAPAVELTPLEDAADEDAGDDDTGDDDAPDLPPPWRGSG